LGSSAELRHDDHRFGDGRTGPPRAPGPSLGTGPLHQRELSWIAFNDRVLEEALDERNPLLERLKFIAIYGTNLDEFS